MADSVWYVYGIVPPTMSTDGAPPGLEDAAVGVERGNGLAALVSALDALEYAPAPLERNTADVHWLGSRAVAHDRVLSWASDRAAVVPLPMFSLFSGKEAVRAMLHERGPQLNAALQKAASGREYALRVYRVDAEIDASLSDLSTRIADLQHAALASPPGQRYLLERKLATERKAEMRSIGQRVATEVFDTLRVAAISAVQSPIPTAVAADAPGTMVLNAAFLVAPELFPDFQVLLSEAVARHQRGFRFDFTGPWPAYHFVHQDRDGI